MKTVLVVVMALFLVGSVSAITMSCPSGYTEIQNCDYSSSADTDDCGYSGGTLTGGNYEATTDWSFWTSGDLNLGDYTSIVALYNATHPSDHTTYKFYGFEESGTTDNHHLLCEDAGSTQTCKPEPTYSPDCTGITFGTVNIYQTEWNDTSDFYETTIDDGGGECSFSVSSATINGSAGRDYLRHSIGSLGGGTFQMHHLIVCAPSSEVVSDTCTYSSGDWEISCSDNCSIDSEQDLGGNDIIISNSSGTGTINFNTPPVNWALMAIENGCLMASG